MSHPNLKSTRFATPQASAQWLLNNQGYWQMSDVPNREIDEQMIATAYHEAGHAIVAISLGRTVEKCTIVRNTIRLGAVQLGKKRGQRQQDYFDVEAMILLGGLVSEARHTGQYNWGGAQQDLRALRRLTLARVDSDKQVERLEKRLLDKTTHHLEQPGHWEALELVVADLIKQQAISGRSARHIFDQTMKLY